RAFKLHAQTPGRPVALGASHALVLGAGGGARAAARAIREAGGRVTVAGRDAKKAAKLASELGVASIAGDAIPSVAYDVLVHCTPVGSAADPGKMPIQSEWLRAGTLVLDAVYRPLKTPLLVEALKKGCTPVPGG